MNHTIDHITSNPSQFKVCKRCGSINTDETIICHNCGKKRFSHSYKRLIKIVGECHIDPVVNTFLNNFVNHTELKTSDQ